MKAIHALSRWLLPMVIVAACLVIAPQTATANVLDKFINAYEEIEKYAPANALPVSSADFKTSKGLFSCIANNKNDANGALICIDDFHNTPLGQQASQAGGIPSEFWMLLNAYIAYIEGDYWGVAYHLGKAAVCAVLHVLAGGVDVCGLIEELVELAEEFYDTAKAIAQFVKSVGEAAWKGIKAAGCALGLGGCGESKPPVWYAYEYVFKPKIPDGVKRIKESYSNFVNLQDLLYKNAMESPPIVSFPDFTIGKTYASQIQAGAKNASAMYADAVYAGWTQDVTKNVLPALATKRNEYNNQAKVAEVAQKAADAYLKNTSVGPITHVGNICADYFKTSGFEHVDRWIERFPETASSLNVMTHQKWCLGVFWAGNKAEFAEQFRNFAKANLCQAGVTKGLSCTDLKKYEQCLGLMGSVDLKNECGVNTSVVGKAAAQKIADHFKANGSVIPCEIKSVMMKAGSSEPVNFVCKRPTQGHACKDANAKFFGHLPVNLVNCVVKEDDQYLALKNQVNPKVVETLKKEFGQFFGVDQLDPLVVWAPSWAALEQVQKGPNQNFGFGPPSTKPGFDYLFALTRTIDGKSTPALVFEVKQTKNVVAAKDLLQAKTELMKPGDPDPTGPGAMVKAAPSPTLPAVQTPEVQPSKPLSGELPPKGSADSGVPARVVTVPSTLPVPQAQTPPEKTLRGDLPTGSQTTARRMLPDITFDAKVMVAGISAARGGAVTVDARSALRTTGTQCQFAIQYGVRNEGQAPTGLFSSMWQNVTTAGTWSRTWPSIPQGGLSIQTDLVMLNTGPNMLRLTLDQLNQVEEANETNNMHTVTINVSGYCGAATPERLEPSAPPPVMPAPGPSIPAPTRTTPLPPVRGR